METTLDLIMKQSTFMTGKVNEQDTLTAITIIREGEEVAEIRDFPKVRKLNGAHNPEFLIDIQNTYKVPITTNLLGFIVYEYERKVLGCKYSKIDQLVYELNTVDSEYNGTLFGGKILGNKYKIERSRDGYVLMLGGNTLNFKTINEISKYVKRNYGVGITNFNDKDVSPIRVKTNVEEYTLISFVDGKVSVSIRKGLEYPKEVQRETFELTRVNIKNLYADYCTYYRKEPLSLTELALFMYRKNKIRKAEIINFKEMQHTLKSDKENKIHA